jgi:hypothetical protein
MSLLSDNQIPLYTTTSKDWYLSGEKPNYAVDLNVGVNEYIFGRTTPDNNFVVSSGLVADSKNGIKMIGGYKKVLKTPTKKVTLPVPKKKVLKTSTKKVTLPVPKKKVPKKKVLKTSTKKVTLSVPKKKVPKKKVLKKPTKKVTLPVPKKKVLTPLKI